MRTKGGLEKVAGTRLLGRFRQAQWSLPLTFFVCICLFLTSPVSYMREFPILVTTRVSGLSDLTALGAMAGAETSASYSPDVRAQCLASAHRRAVASKTVRKSHGSGRRDRRTFHEVPPKTRGATLSFRHRLVPPLHTLFCKDRQQRIRYALLRDFGESLSQAKTPVRGEKGTPGSEIRWLTEGVRTPTSLTMREIYECRGYEQNVSLVKLSGAGIKGSGKIRERGRERQRARRRRRRT